MSTIRTAYENPVTLLSPLEASALLPKSMTGTEQLGRPFEYTVELFSQQPEKVKAQDLLGQPMTLQLELADGQTRYFNGHVSRFAQRSVEGDVVHYQATLVPWLWFLTRTSDCRIFQKKTVPTIIKEVFRAFEFSHFEEKLTGEYREWEYCVQYRETAFNFVSRLMEQEGIYYYFKHDQNTHTLVLADSPSAHEDAAGYEEIQYLPVSEGLSWGEFISEWAVEHQFQPGKYTLNDYNFKTPQTDLKSITSTVLPVSDFKQYEVYDYPGEYTNNAEGTAYSKIRMEEIEACYETASGVSDARGISVGYKFKLTKHPIDDQNKTYLITTATYHLDAGGYTASDGTDELVYSCGFTAIDTQRPFRPPLATPKPIVQGPQTAVVVGPSGQEIWPDKFAQVKVKFHWDRHNPADESASCWMRVSQVHAGKGFGAIDLPRIGEEVIVEHLEGDPDRPIITGRVYNAINTPPTDLPGAGATSGMKSKTVKGGGFNGMTMDDTAGAEAVSIHGQHNMDTTVENDQTNTVNNNQTNTIACNQTNAINANRETSVAADDAESVGSNKKLDIGSNLDSMVGSNLSSMIGGRQTETVGGSSLVTVAGKRMESVGGGHMFTNPKMAMAVGGKYMVNAGGSIKQSSPKVDLKAGAKMSATSGGPVKVKAGGPIKQQSGGAFSIKAGAAIKEQAGGAFNIKAGGALKQQGANIKLKGPTKVAGKTKITGPTKIKGTTLTVS